MAMVQKQALAEKIKIKTGNTTVKNILQLCCAFAGAGVAYFVHGNAAACEYPCDIHRANLKNHLSYCVTLHPQQQLPQIFSKSNISTRDACPFNKK